MINRKAGAVLMLLAAYMAFMIVSYQMYGDALYLVRTNYYVPPAQMQTNDPSYQANTTQVTKPTPLVNVVWRSWESRMTCVLRSSGNITFHIPSQLTGNHSNIPAAVNISFGNISLLHYNGTFYNSTHICMEIPPTITLFTTFQNSPAKEFIYKNTIRNWAMLKPFVRPVFYHIPGNLELVDFAKRHGWEVYQVPKVSNQNVPVLRTMFLHAQDVSHTEFYGYVNGDIMFDGGFKKTIECLQRNIKQLNKVLVVGQRSNYKLGKNEVVPSLQWVSSLKPKSKIFNANAQDYFISTKNGYPWKSIADFVVGRIGYDNWLVVNAITSNIPVIDATHSILAIHQTGKDGNFAGHIKKSAGDTYINYRYAGSKFSYSLGFTTCAHMTTEWEGNEVKLKHRQKVDGYCRKQFAVQRKNPEVFFKWKLLRR